jgi:hypothetical protein
VLVNDLTVCAGAASEQTPTPWICSPIEGFDHEWRWPKQVRTLPHSALNRR